MKFHPTEVEGCSVVELEPISDDRGYFARAWCSEEMKAAGAVGHVSQINMSRSILAGTIRGLHWQTDPYGEGKFVRCIAGRVFDVCVDVRPASPTFMKWTGTELTPENRRALSVPAGCAHGYQALDPNSEVLYLVSAPYQPGVERGIRWDDPAFGIAWPSRSGALVSDKDASWPDFQ